MASNKVFNFKSKDQNRELFCQSFSSSSNPKGQLVITHGLGEHSGAYAELASQIALDLDLEVLAWDMYGHGKSEGKRGYVGDIRWLLNDFVHFLDLHLVHKNAFLLSHSLGGLLHLFAEQEGLLDHLNIKGSIFSNPCTKLNFTPPKWKTAGANLLANTAPWVTLDNEIRVQDLSSLPKYWKIHKQDHLRHKKISPRLFLGLLELSQNLGPRKSSTPALSLISTHDPVCSAKVAQFILQKTSKLLLFEESKHEVLNDVEKQSAYHKIKEFLYEKINT